MYDIVWRTTPTQEDIKNIYNIVSSSGYFNQEEIAIATELIEERLQHGETSDYYFLFAEINNKTIGYTCYGPIPGTQSGYDLYWIAVNNSYRKKGIGRILLDKTEHLIVLAGGKKIYVETSGKDQYIETRQFYLKNNYIEKAKLDDFYAPGDDKLILVKNI